MASQRKRARTEKISENPNEQKEKETLGRDSGYEQFRDQRIKENMQRMQKLGILELSRKLKPEIVAPKSSRNISDKKTLKDPPLESYEPSRRSSRLKSVTPVSYKELRNTSKKERLKREICIPEGSKPEIYTEEHDKLLGECKTTWNLCVDGCDKNGKRIYDPVKGETCHQCRQKTLGHHTHCSICKLVQGQLCGDCLYMRYGENVIEADRNSSWICPVCRGICNCSLCRKAKGWAPTGNLYRKVLNLGFKSVTHYLIQTRRSQPISEDPDSENSISMNESSPFACGSVSLHDDPLEEDEVPDVSILEEDEGPDDDKDAKIEEEEEVHLLVNKHISELSNPQLKDEVVDKGVVIRGYNKHDDDDGIRKEKEDQGN